MSDPRCAETRELAAELALGVVEGEERGRALQHLADCPDCRRRVDELSAVADELLLLAPHREVPLGFEERAAPLRPAPRAPRRFRRVLIPAAAAAAAVAVTLAAVGDDLRLASHYRDTLSEADGKQFEATSLYAPGEVDAGTAFGYEGSPSWLLVVVDAEHRVGVRGAELVMSDGKRIPLRSFSLDPPSGSWGMALPVDLRDVSVLRLLPAQGGQEALVAKLSE
jgi:hypothetical protein